MQSEVQSAAGLQQVLYLFVALGTAESLVEVQEDQFGYTETYAVLSENKLTVVSGAFLSSDMMERQSFSQLMSKFAENVKY